MHALKGEAPAFAALTVLLRRQAPNKDKKNKMIYSRNFKRKFLQHLFGVGRRRHRLTQPSDCVKGIVS